MQKITIKHNGKVISLESSDAAAGVPDTTDGAGPALPKLEDDIQKNPSDPQAEFDAANPATQTATEKDDKPEEAGKKANESMMAGFLKSLNGAQKKQLAAILSRESDDPDAGAATEPVTPAEPVAPTSTVGEEDNGEGVGEVTQTANETVVEANGLTITISDDASAAPEAPAEPATEATDSADPNAAAPAAGTEGACAKGKGSGCTEGSEPAPAGSTSLESFFANLNLANL